jgi:hypothetical protein
MTGHGLSVHRRGPNKIDEFHKINSRVGIPTNVKVKI